MIIQQRNPTEFKPVSSYETVFVRDSVATPSPVTHRQFEFDEYSGGSGHNEYIFSGNDITSIQVHSSTPPDSVDLSDLPTVKRADGVDAFVYAKFTNGRGISATLDLNFLDQGDATYRVGPTGAVTDSYAEYSLTRVKAIFDELSSASMFDTSGNRAHVEIIPHASFTCHAYGGPRAPLTSLRFTAITPRHLAGVAHYGYKVGDVVQFRTVANVPVYRTIQARWNPNTYTPGVMTSDFQLFLLDSDLPESIAPAPIVGEWFSQVQSGTDTVVCCPQHVGLTVWNNDGHITPTGRMDSEDINRFMAAQTLDSVAINALSTLIMPESSRVTIIGDEQLDYSSPLNPFYHNRRSGDSGSPCFAPVADGWALCGLVSGNLWSADKLNEAIARVDFHAGVSTEHTVTVAPDPTL